jgi:hypothetical protein
MIAVEGSVKRWLGDLNPYGAAFCSIFGLCLLGIAAAALF